MAGSVVGELEALEARVRQRLSELEPLVDEYRELEQVAQRLGIASDRAAAGKASPPAKRASRRAPASRAKPRRATSRQQKRNGRAGTHSDQLLTIVKQHPGITVREASKQMGVDGTSLYRVVRRLEQTGAIKKAGRALQPV